MAIFSHVFVQSVRLLAVVALWGVFQNACLAQDAPQPKQSATETNPDQPPSASSPVQTQKLPHGERHTDTREAMCLMIESAAKANDLPLEFFSRVIWQESRFKP